MSSRPLEHQTSKHHLPLLPSLLAVGSGIVWSSGAVMSRRAEGVDAFQYLIWRSVGVIVVTEAINLLRRAPLQTVRAWTTDRTLALANFALFLSSIGFVYAVKTTTPANAAFLASLSPLLAVVLARFLGERLTRSTIVALALGLVGLIVTVFGDLGSGNMTGNIVALLSSVGFALYTVCLRTDATRDWSPVMPGYAILMIVVCVSVTLAHGKPLVPSFGDMAYALVHGGIVIVTGTFMFNRASKRVPAVPMTVFAQAEAVFVPVWAFLILGDRPPALTLLGGAIIFTSVVGKAVYDASAGLRVSAVNAPDVPLL